MHPYVPNLTTTDGVGKILCFQAWNRWVIGKILSNKIPTHPWNIPQIPLESKDENDSLHKQVVLSHPHIVLINTSSFFTFGPKLSPFFGRKKNTSKNTCGKRRLKIGCEGPFPSFAQIVGEYLLFPMVSYCSLMFLLRNPKGSLTKNHILYTLYSIYPHFGSQRKFSIQTPFLEKLSEFWLQKSFAASGEGGLFGDLECWEFPSQNPGPPSKKNSKIIFLESKRPDVEH